MRLREPVVLRREIGDAEDHDAGLGVSGLGYTVEIGGDGAFLATDEGGCVAACAEPGPHLFLALTAVHVALGHFLRSMSMEELGRQGRGRLSCLDDPPGPRMR